MKYKDKNRSVIKSVAEYLKSKNLEEDVNFAELGVKYGLASVMCCKILGKDGYLFDTWTTFPSFAKQDIGQDVLINKGYRAHKWSEDKLKKRIRNGKSTFKECKKNLIKGGVYKECHMIQGDIAETVPDFCLKNKDKRFCMIHIDTNLYESTKIGLDYFYPMLIEGGFILVQDAGDTPVGVETKEFGRVWIGVKSAVNEFLKSNNNVSCFSSFDFSAICIVKGENYKFDDFVTFLNPEIVHN